MAVLQPAAEQDLRIITPVGPDIRWPAHQNPQFLIPEPGRTDAPHQLVTMKNHDMAQTHIIVDRFLQGHELQAGQSKEIDMLVEDIKYFQRQRRPRTSMDGRMLPSIPIEVVGVPDIPEVEVKRSVLK